MLLILSNCIAQTPCPVKGDKDNLKFEHLDSLKNRNTIGLVDNSISLQSILVKGNDEKRFTSSQYIRLTGYVILVKAGGGETCNCHSKEAGDLDIHIELALNLSDKANEAIVIEINRFTKTSNPELTLKKIKDTYLHQKVVIEGWMFFDEEHKQNAVNTNPSGGNLWRATCWEVHPVMKITKIN